MAGAGKIRRVAHIPSLNDPAYGSWYSEPVTISPNGSKGWRTQILIELHGKFQFSEAGAVGRDLTGFAGVWCNEEVPACDTPQ